jgi:fatty-acid peroxygenase
MSEATTPETTSGTGNEVQLVHIPGDQSLRFLTEGYAFGRRRFEEHGTDAFRTRLLGRTATMLRGTDAAEFFYGEGRFRRVGGMPRSAFHSLQDEGSVQTLEGPAHRGRKRIFLDLMTDEHRAALAHRTAEAWEEHWSRWVAASEPVSLIRAAERVLTDAALRWLGVESSAIEQRARTDEFHAMLDGAGAFGPRNWYGRRRRLQTERWARAVVREHRASGSGDVDTPLGRLLQHREAGGPLDEGTAAIELLNLLRPTVAVAWFVGFAGLALHRHPVWRERVVTDDHQLFAFTEEVRRTAPFFPAIGGRAVGAQTWRGVTFAPGDWVLVDFFATQRDPRVWPDPDRFDPSRFAVPEHHHVIVQGAGSMPDGHRCPGEPATVDLLRVLTRALARATWDVPAQDLRVDLRRMPALPGREGLLIRPRG